MIHALLTVTKLAKFYYNTVFYSVEKENSARFWKAFVVFFVVVWHILRVDPFLTKGSVHQWETWCRCYLDSRAVQGVFSLQAWLSLLRHIFSPWQPCPDPNVSPYKSKRSRCLRPPACIWPQFLNCMCSFKQSCISARQNVAHVFVI